MGSSIYSLPFSLYSTGAILNLVLFTAILLKLRFVFPYVTGLECPFGFSTDLVGTAGIADLSLLVSMLAPWPVPRISATNLSMAICVLTQ